MMGFKDVIRNVVLETCAECLEAIAQATPDYEMDEEIFDDVRDCINEQVEGWLESYISDIEDDESGGFVRWLR